MGTPGQGLEGLDLPSPRSGRHQGGHGCPALVGRQRFLGPHRQLHRAGALPSRDRSTPGGPLFGVQFSSLPCTDFKSPAAAPRPLRRPRRAALYIRMAGWRAEWASRATASTASTPTPPISTRPPRSAPPWGAPGLRPSGARPRRQHPGRRHPPSLRERHRRIDHEHRGRPGHRARDPARGPALGPGAQRPRAERARPHRSRASRCGRDRCSPPPTWPPSSARLRSRRR